jgi:copper ion binding protein
MAKIKLKIQGMSCQHCVKTVTDALTGLEGVQSAKVNLRKNEAVVNFDPSRIDSDNLTKTVTEVGFEVVEEIKPIPVGDSAPSTEWMEAMHPGRVSHCRCSP